MLGQINIIADLGVLSPRRLGASFLKPILMVIFLALTGSPPAGDCASPAPNITLSNKKIYTVRMQTMLTIPKKKEACEQVRVWHALPTNKPWSQVKAPKGCFNVACTPKEGIVEPEEDELSEHVFWNEKRNFKPGDQLSFTSQFSLVSCDRSFNPSARTIAWDTYDPAYAKLKAKLKESNIEIINLAKQLKGNHNPAITVQEICKWIYENIKYNGRCTWDTADVSRTLKEKEGHCGHQNQVFTHLCAACAIPTRTVVGISMRSPSGKSTQADLGDSEINTHSWSEVFLPGCGWVEVEPQHGVDCFTIHADSIQCNSQFQAYAVWVTEKGEETRQERCIFRSGAYQGEYRVVHLISFSEKAWSGKDQ